MSKHEKPHENNESTAMPEDQLDDASEQADAQENASDQADKTPEQCIEELQLKVDELNQRLLRAAADYQNLARRSEQNTKAAREQAIVDIARGMMTALDHFDRALQVDPNATPAQSVLDGVGMVHGELLRTLAQFGIERVEVEPGEPFDPNHHEAMMREQSEEVETNHVVRQFQPGYTINGKSLRAAGVSVAE